jgi:hypothetical protein
MNRIYLSVTTLLLAALLVVSGCQRMVDVQTGTRTVDSQGRVISQNIKTIRVPADKAGDYRVVTITKDTAPADRLAALYDEAQKALGNGDTKLALQKLDELLAISPDYRAAKTQREAIKAGKKVSPDTSSSSSGSKPTTTTPPSQPTETAGALLKWVPDALTGFTAEKPLVDPLSVSRQYTPKSGTSADSLVIAAEQFRSSDEAKAALKSQVKQRYTKDADTRSVHGHDVYFATDGKRFAVMAFVSGSAMVAVEAARDAGSPAKLDSVLEKVVGELP